MDNHTTKILGRLRVSKDSIRSLSEHLRKFFLERITKERLIHKSRKDKMTPAVQKGL